ncbi:MAG: hypothetical protein CEO12_221 [Parcubacteria group bacterium Gr01-1014_46]|nr:MAG: hypothetical protein CEO12_221 [Parcubacteria group bacterium Gr01-1014_46]
MSETKTKKHLPNVTLITFDCVNLKQTLAAADICEREFSFGAVKVLSSIPSDDPRVVPVPELLNNWQKYSEFYIREFAKHVDTEYALCFHPDSFIANPSAWEDDFLKYDYLGSPWYQFGGVKVGGGGFSVRSKRLLDYISNNYLKIGGPFHPEDLWICKTARPFLEKEGMTFGPPELATRFSKEGSLRGVHWNGEFGWHGSNSTDMSKWFEKNPQYREIFPQKFDDFTEFMRRYPVEDKTFHVLQCKPIQVEHYKELASGKKNYDARINTDLVDIPGTALGHKLVYKLFRISVKQVGVGTFERKIKSIEKFNTKKELLEKHPEVKITPSFSLPKWKQRLVKIFGNIIFPNNKSYTLFNFEQI